MYMAWVQGAHAKYKQLLSAQQDQLEEDSTCYFCVVFGGISAVLDFVTIKRGIGCSGHLGMCIFLLTNSVCVSHRIRNIRPNLT